MTTPFVKIEVKDEIDRPEFINKFVVDVKFMHGDADSYETRTVSFKSKSILGQFILLLERCANFYPYGKSGYDDYSEVPGYSDFFDDEVEDTNGEQLYWPSFDGIVTSFDSYTVKFYDETGSKHSVVLTFGDLTDGF